MTDKNLTEKLAALLKRAIERDESLRTEFSIGSKFRFVRDQLQSLLAGAQAESTSLSADIAQEKTMAENEREVYVHLFNAQGMDLKSWEKLLHSSVFYEHGVNRPIYSSLADVKAFLRAARVKAQHGFLKVIILRSAVLPVKDDVVVKDIYGHALLKLNEGSLKFERCVGFLHNDMEYKVSADGKLL